MDPDVDGYFILEDDVKFNVPKDVVFDYLRNLPREAELVNFVRDITFHPLIPAVKINDYYSYVIREYFNYASAYFVTKSGAQKLIAYCDGKGGLSADDLLSNAVVFGNHDLCMVAPSTCLFYMDTSLDSDIIAENQHDESNKLV